MALVRIGSGQVSISSLTTAYTQNFNSLKAKSGTSTALPTGWRLLETGSSANTSYTTNAGSSTTGDTYSYGTGTNSDRALGMLRSGSVASTVGVQFRNTTGQTVSSITVSYVGEQWRCGATGRADQIDFQYALNATSLSTGTWADVNELDFTSLQTASIGAKDGNAAANRTTKTFTVTGLSIANNAIFWLRWVDADASGADDGLAIDDFSIRLGATAPPPPPPSPSVSVTPNSLTFGTISFGSTSTPQTFSFTASNLTASLTLSAPVSFTLSKDNVSYASSLVYATTELTSARTVYVKFTPAAANTSYTGTVNFSSTGLISSPISLSGNSNVTTPTGPLNHYFGNLHAHSSYSDGNADDLTKVPADDYAFAKTAMCMDFLGISEHNHASAGMQLADWQPGRQQAAAATTSTFVAMYGMEWGVISGGGHVIVYGMDSLIGWESGNYQIYVPKSQYVGSTGLFHMLNRHGGNALAYLAHPENTDFNNILTTYDAGADAAVVGTAVESGPAFSTNTTYTNPGTSMAKLTYYKNMLARGYKLGPTIDHDNHNMTFGKTARTRTVIMAPELTENALLSAMKQMRFYASQDCSAKIVYQVNGQPLGSVLTQAGTPTITLSTTTSTSPITSVRIMMGVPGSGVAATTLSTQSSGNFTYIDNALSNGATRYYYLEITESDGTRIVTAPVWYTRNDAASARSTATVVQSSTQPGVSRTLAIYPNPVQDRLKLLVDTDAPQSLQAEVYDLQGRRLKSVRYALVNGNQQLDLSVQSLPAGTYLLKTTMGNERGARLFQKQ
jgi:hypothetical protein